MVFSAHIPSEIVIDAPPEKVRAQFLDFGNLLRYTTNLFRSIRPKRAGSDEPVDAIDAVPGDTLTIATSTGLTPRVEANLLENSESAFRYRYVASGYTATHSFEYIALPGDPRKTTFKQTQTIEGPAAWLFWFISPLRWAVLDTKSAGFNADLKKAVEAN